MNFQSWVILGCRGRMIFFFQIREYIYSRHNLFKAEKFQEAMFFIILPEVNVQVQNDHGVLSRLLLCILHMGLAYSVLNGRFGHVYLLQVSKNDDQEHCFLK